MPVIRNFVIGALVLVLWSNAAALGTLPISSSTAVSQKLRWKSNSVRIAVSQSLLRTAPNIKADSDVTGAVRRSLEAWQGVANVDFVQDVSEKQSVSPAGPSGDGISLVTVAATPENVLLFGRGEDATAARTRVFLNRRGFITEADIVLSPFQQFSTDGTFGTFDLEATLKHEIGHLLGLRHSAVVGSIMYDVSARNGVFGEIGLDSGRITDDDIAAIRDLYGTVDDDACCGDISGRLTGVSKNTRSIDVWAQVAETGRVDAHGTVSRDGSFHIGGLANGTYDVAARENGRLSDSFIFRIGQVVIEKGESVSVARKLTRLPRDFSVQFLGKNGILSDSPVKLHKGNTYTLYIGGKNLASDRLYIETDSRFVTIDRSSLANMAYDDGLSGLSFELTVDAETPLGNYSVCAVSESGARDCIVGGLSILD
jgi:hypothetical protein